MKKRIAYWDNLKYLMIVFVIVGHFILENNSGISSPFYNSFSVYIYLFHIPTFFFISGYFFKKKSALWNAFTYVLYAIATKLIMFFGKWAVYTIAIKIFNRQVKYEPVNLSFVKYNDMIWFLIVLAIVEFLMFVLDKTNSKVLLVLAIVVGCLVGYFSVVGATNTLGDYFAWFRVLVMFPFFAFGKVIKEYNLVEKLREKNGIRIISGVVIVGVFLLFMLNESNISGLTSLFSGRNSYEIISKNWRLGIVDSAVIYRVGALLRLVTYLATFIMCLSWTLVIPDKNIPFFTKCGSKTILIFMFHYLGLYFVNAMGWSNIIATRSGKVIFILGAIAWTLLLSLLFFKAPDLIKEGVLRIRKKADDI